MDIIMNLYSGPKSPTKLMYATNLSWAPLKECLKNLIARGLVIESEMRSGSERTSKRKVYALTQRGSNIIGRYREFMKELAL